MLEHSLLARGLTLFFWCVEDNNSAFIYVGIASPAKEMYWTALNALPTIRRDGSLALTQEAHLPLGGLR